MSGVFDGLRVLDLSWGRAGPMVGMLLADHGADVTRIEAPGGDPCADPLGYKVWNRGKRSALLDLKNGADRDTFLALAAHADILIESYAPGVSARLGIDFATLHALNPRLIYCSITGYGRDNSHSDRPGYDALVAARCGLQWEQRGWPEGALNHLAGRLDPFADFDVPADYVQGAPRPGPLFVASHWPSLGAAFSALLALSAALLARAQNGRGQWVETSLLQGALASAAGVWQRAENVEAPGFDTWILGSKAPKGHFQCRDGRWVHNWVMNPRFILTASEGERLDVSPDLSVQNDPSRFGTAPEELFAIVHYQPILAERMRKFSAREWVEAAAVAGVTVQDIRAPEEALNDPWFLADGCVAELNDPELGPIRQVGIAYRLDSSPGHIRGPAPRIGEHTAAIRAEAAALPRPPQAGAQPAAAGAAPLAGVRVLDLGLAIAGPFGTQLLSDLGADVIKVNALHDTYWHANQIAFMSNRGKRSIALNLKDERALAILHELVAGADVVQHNMRYDAAQRLGIDYESLKRINPRLIYCHTRGFERDSPRTQLPGNEQTGIALTGVQYEDGGMARGGRPMWTLTGFGDMGNGFLSAAAIVQALYHRARTGVGQFCDTSIVNACLLNTSYAVAFPDGGGPQRPHIDALQFGFNALCRLYQTAQSWLCLVAATEAHWRALCAALPDAALAQDARFTSADARAQNDAALAQRLAEVFAAGSAADWFARLDGAGVPCEISDPTFSLGLHDDPEWIERGWVASFQHPLVGRLDQIGLCANLSATPGRVQNAPFVVGQHSVEILRELGWSDEAIAAARAAGYVAMWDGGAAPERVRRSDR